VRFIADRGSTSAGEAVDEFAAARKLARSTVLTMMERLRQKGQLRRLVDGVYRYRTATSSADLMKRAVHRFVDRNLDGSVSPFSPTSPKPAGLRMPSCASSKTSSPD
jgi:predicted transcriptional regulator